MGRFQKVAAELQQRQLHVGCSNIIYHTSQASLGYIGLHVMGETWTSTSSLPLGHDTAGFREPPEMPPMANPPTVTQEPMARPNK